MNSLFEQHRQTLILALCILILLGSGVSLGIGVVDLQRGSELTQVESLSPQAPSKPSVNYPLDINTAPQEELEILPGIGATKAKAIVEYRQASGLFKSIEEITNVPGIGPKTFERIKGLIMAGQ